MANTRYKKVKTPLHYIRRGDFVLHGGIYQKVFSTIQHERVGTFIVVVFETGESVIYDDVNSMITAKRKVRIEGN